MKIEITKEEIQGFNYILPALASFKALELIDVIVEKIKNGGEVDFTDDEFDFMISCINNLDSQKQLPYQFLSLIKKFVYYDNNKGEK